MLALSDISCLSYEDPPPPFLVISSLVTIEYVSFWIPFPHPHTNWWCRERRFEAPADDARGYINASSLSEVESKLKYSKESPVMFS